MSRTTKIVLAVLAGLLLICGGGACGAFFLAGVAARKAVITDRVKVKAVAQGIADYSLPTGYSEAFAFNALGVSMAAFLHDGGNVIMLMQTPASQAMDQAQMELQMTQVVERQLGRRNMTMKVVDRKAATIRGQEVTLLVSEGTDSSGARLMSMTGAFPGKGGQAVLMVMGPSATWDEAAIDSFVESLR